MNAFNLTGTRYACKRRRNGHAAHVGKRMYVCTCMPQIRAVGWPKTTKYRRSVYRKGLR